MASRGCRTCAIAPPCTSAAHQECGGSWPAGISSGWPSACAPSRCLRHRGSRRRPLWPRDVKLVKRELAINIARTLVDGKPVEKPPKTKAGERTLPLDDALAAR
jgi:hypothetical protein